MPVFRVGVILYSKSTNTLAVANLSPEDLAANDYSCIIQLEETVQKIYL